MIEFETPFIEALYYTYLGRSLQDEAPSAMIAELCGREADGWAACALYHETYSHPDLADVEVAS